MTTGIIFDCFGVLYNDATTDFLKHHQASLDALPASYAHLAKVNDEVDRGKVGGEVYYRELGAATGLTPREVEAEMSDVSGLDAGVVALIRELKPRYQIGMLTNADALFLQRFLDNQDVRELFDVVVVSSEIGFIKPEPEIVTIIAERMGKKFDELIFIDDKQMNVVAAQRLGIDSILFHSAAQTREELQVRGCIVPKNPSQK